MAIVNGTSSTAAMERVSSRKVKSPKLASLTSQAMALETQRWSGMRHDGDTARAQAGRVALRQEEEDEREEERAEPKQSGRWHRRPTT